MSDNPRMDSQKYFYYDENACELVPVHYSTVEKIIYNASLWLITGIVMAGIGITILASTAGTPAEIALKAENHVLVQQLNKTKKTITTIDTQIDSLAKTDNEIYRSVLGMKPISYGEREAGVGGADIYAKFDSYSDPAAHVLKWTAGNLESIQRKINIQKVSFSEIKNYYNKNKVRLAHTPAIRPVKGIVLSGFGMRYHPILHLRRMHEGLDFRASVGTPVYATADGVIKYASRDGTYGNLVEINHGYGFQTRYAHLSKFAKGIRPGKKVKRGDIIAYSGDTGLTEGPHLHYEVRINGTPVNPLYYLFGDLTPEEYSSFKKISNENTSSLD